MPRLRRVATLATLLTTLVTPLALVVGPAPAGAQTATPPPVAATPTPPTPMPAAPATCDATLAAAAADAPIEEPAEGFARWWASSALAAARTAPACVARGLLPEPRWRGRVAFQLASGRPDLAPALAWLVQSSFPPARVPNPTATLVDAAAVRARQADPDCRVAPGLLGALLWLGDPGLLTGDVTVTDDGDWTEEAPAGLVPLWAALGLPLHDPEVGPPTVTATLDRAAGWLCQRTEDLATPEGRRAALAPLLGEAANVSATLSVADRYGDQPLDPHVTIPSARTLQLVKVQGFTVAANVAPHLERLLADAAADGLILKGGAYRSAEAQIERRRANCAGEDGVADDYDLYEKPSSQCSPPTARPGSSRHETGEAIDFERCWTRDTDCYRWLARYAHRYGLVNYPVEPWHWSTTGQ